MKFASIIMSNRNRMVQCYINQEAVSIVAVCIFCCNYQVCKSHVFVPHI